MNRTVAIVGSENRTRGLAPYDDPSIDIWVFNEAANQDWCKRATAVFQLHAPGIYRSPNNRSDPAHWDWLQKTHDGLTVYMQEADPLVPCSSRYPLDDIVAALLPGFRQGVELTLSRYFTSTVAYALALAIYQGYERILLYGVEMRSDTEYTYQRPCVLFWVGVGLGRGIAVDFVSGDEIFDVPMYGYEGILETDPKMFIERATELRVRVGELLDQKAQIEKEIRTSAALNGNLSKLITSLIDTYGHLGKVEGALAENERYAFRAASMLETGGLAYIDRSEYEINAAMNKNEADEHIKALLRAQGRIDVVMHVWETQHDPRALEQIKDLAMSSCDLASRGGRALGVFEENARYMTEMDRRIQAAGGQKAAEMMEVA